MVMTILLLVCAVIQLVIPAPSTSPDPSHLNLNLNHIIAEAHKCKDIFAKELFVEDVQDLMDAGCKSDFFCKVHMILSKHEKSEEPKKKELSLVRYLGTYINNTHIDCPEVLKTVRNSTVTRPITVLLDNISKCSRKKNLGV